MKNVGDTFLQWKRKYWKVSSNDGDGGCWDGDEFASAVQFCEKGEDADVVEEIWELNLKSPNKLPM